MSENSAMQLADVSPNRHEVRSIVRVAEYDVARPDSRLSVDECGGVVAAHRITVVRIRSCRVSSAKPKEIGVKVTIIIGLDFRSGCIGSVTK